MSNEQHQDDQLLQANINVQQSVHQQDNEDQQVPQNENVQDSTSDHTTNSQNHVETSRLLIPVRYYRTTRRLRQRVKHVHRQHSDCESNANFEMYAAFTKIPCVQTFVAMKRLVTSKVPNISDSLYKSSPVAEAYKHSLEYVCCVLQVLQTTIISGELYTLLIIELKTVLNQKTIPRDVVTRRVVPFLVTLQTRNTPVSDTSDNTFHSGNIHEVVSAIRSLNICVVLFPNLLLRPFCLNLYHYANLACKYIETNLSEDLSSVVQLLTQIFQTLYVISTFSPIDASVEIPDYITLLFNHKSAVYDVLNKMVPEKYEVMLDCMIQLLSIHRTKAIPALFQIDFNCRDIILANKFAAPLIEVIRFTIGKTITSDNFDISIKMGRETVASSIFMLRQHCTFFNRLLDPYLTMSQVGSVNSIGIREITLDNVDPADFANINRWILGGGGIVSAMSSMSCNDLQRHLVLMDYLGYEEGCCLAIYSIIRTSHEPRITLENLHEYFRLSSEVVTPYSKQLMCQCFLFAVQNASDKIQATLLEITSIKNQLD